MKVRVAIDIHKDGCGQRIEIKNLPTWDGAPNPTMPGDLIWFLGVESEIQAFDDTPFYNSPEPLGCFSGGPPTCGLHDDYQWRFQVAGNPADPGVAVLMGDSAYWGANLSTGFEYVSVHNLRSLSSGACDEYEFAYWMKHEYPLD